MKNAAGNDHEIKHSMTVAECAIIGAASFALLAMALCAGLLGSRIGIVGLWLAAALVPAVGAMRKLRFGRLILVADASFVPPQRLPWRFTRDIRP